jgi:ABC-2 type transport system permease protein
LSFFVRLTALALKELRQLRRDRLTLAMTIAFPLMQLLLFGYAINTDVRNINTVVWDQDHSVSSRDFLQRMRATGSFTLVGHVETYEEIEQSFRRGHARVALVIPPSFARDLARKRPVLAQLVVDGSDPLVIASATSTAAGVAQSYSPELFDSPLRVVTLSGPRIGVEPTIWYNPDLRTAVYVVPGLVGVILTMTMVMLTSMALARERERGTLEQLIVSPVRRIELVLGKILPYVAIGYIQMSIVLAAGKLIFGVPMQGSLGLLYGLAFLFIAANLSIGLVFSTLAKSQQQAMQMSFFFLLPNILLSGFMFPFEAMPQPAQWLAQVLPLTHFMRIVRGVTLKGSTWVDVQTELVWLGALLTTLLLLASVRVSKKLA